ncbi:MAG TPA: uroporphyrinogen decarboxylase family protein [Sumerlaeia bacterium]|nr:uroporphyrinogen decarboxylase family protein [Sumerlaeia bacterium]
MNQRDRILTVFRGEIPDAVPYMLDLSHWFYHKHRMPWDLSVSYAEPERELIDCHKKAGAGFYMPNLAHFYDVRYADDVKVATEKSDDGQTIRWGIETPLGSIERKRVWKDQTYAWATPEWAVKTERDLAVLAYALGSRSFSPRWENYARWDECVGGAGVVYMPAGYSAMGQLLHYWMGVEAAAYAVCETPGVVREAVDRINANNLSLIDLLTRSPADIVILGDNFSSDVQPPRFFKEWSSAYYEEAVGRLHAAGKRVAVHVDGRLRGALAMMRDVGADCIDAVTPPPMGDLTPEECRNEAGPDLILSGGVSPDLWLPSADLDDFKKAVLEWLDTRERSPRLIAAAGDQVPPGADEDRIRLMRDLVESHGRY